MATAEVNKFASDPVAAVAGGSGSSSSSRGWRSGGVDLEVAFVPMLRRRGDARSGVDVELWALYRSVFCSGWSLGQDLDRGGACRRLLLRSCEGRTCFSPGCAGWSSSGWRWFDGGGSRLRDSGRGEHWDVSRLMFSTGSIGSVSGGPPMQLLKPCWAMVLGRVRRRRSLVDRGEDGVGSLARDLFVFFCSFEGLSAMCLATCASWAFEWVWACSRCNSLFV